MASIISDSGCLRVGMAMISFVVKNTKTDGVLYNVNVSLENRGGAW